MRGKSLLGALSSLLLAGAAGLSSMPDASASAPSAAAAEVSPPPVGHPARGWVAAVEITYRDPNDEREHVHLLSPTGQVRVIGALENFGTKVISVRYDAARIITRSDRDPVGAHLIWNTATRTSVKLQVPDRTSSITALPQGILLRNGATRKVELWDYSGRRLKRYADVAGATGDPVARPSGERFMQARSDGSVVVRATSSGAVVNTVRPPSGTTSCSPRGGWDGPRFLMTCLRPESRFGTAYAGGYTSSTATTRLAPDDWGWAAPTRPRLVAMGSLVPARWADGRLDPFPCAYEGEDPCPYHGELLGATGRFGYFLDLTAPGSRSLFKTDIATMQTVPFSENLYDSAQVITEVGPWIDGP